MNMYILLYVLLSAVYAWREVYGIVSVSRKQTDRGKG